MLNGKKLRFNSYGHFPVRYVTNYQRLNPIEFHEKTHGFLWFSECFPIFQWFFGLRGVDVDRGQFKVPCITYMGPLGSRIHRGLPGQRPRNVVSSWPWLEWLDPFHDEFYGEYWLAILAVPGFTKHGVLENRRFRDDFPIVSPYFEWTSSCHVWLAEGILEKGREPEILVGSWCGETYNNKYCGWLGFNADDRGFKKKQGCWLDKR